MSSRAVKSQPDDTPHLDAAQTPQSDSRNVEQTEPTSMTPEEVDRKRRDIAAEKAKCEKGQYWSPTQEKFVCIE